MRRFTLQQVFALTIVGLALLLAILLFVIYRTSRDALIESSSRIRTEKTERIGERVRDDLERAGRSLRHVEGLLRQGAVRVDNTLAIEAVLFAEVAGEPDISEVTFTHAVYQGEDEKAVSLAPGDRWQISVFRGAEREGSEEEARILTRYDHVEKGGFVCEARERPPHGAFGSVPLLRLASLDIPDPTAHDTFQAAARKRNRGSVLASDLHWFQLDMPLPERQRRVVVSAQQAVEDQGGRFLGVLRVGLLTKRLNELVQRPTEKDPHRVFFCDTQGRLITAIGDQDSVQQIGDDLRVVPASPPPEVQAALRLPELRQMSRDRPLASAAFVVAGEPYLASFRYLEGSQDWIVAMVAPQSFYLGGLDLQRKWMLLASLGIMAVILLLGGLTLRSIRKGLGVVVDSTARMRDFDFSASNVRLPFRDLQEVGERLEVAKTAMRAMGRYVPVDLVRLLYRTGREPVLGGELSEVSLLFTDIEGFTNLSERLEPNELARALGRYFEVMTAVVHEHRGIIDKYIGDAIMALWNVPTPCPEHPRRACEAALHCVRAAEGLFASDEWKGLPRLVTRFGLHQDRVMVGHFGAPDRMSYTALGDGVNLAARLEGLNKQYGTTILVSEAVRQQAGPGFEFRLLDRVAVKGKTRGIEIHELLGVAGESAPAARAYERALQAYWARDFAGAAALLAAQPEDAPSRTLLERCRRFQRAPPSPGWDGIWIATSK